MPQPESARNLADALARLDGRPCVIEAWDDVTRVEARVHDGAATASGVHADAVVAAAALVDVRQAHLLGFVDAAGAVRFDDLLACDGRALGERPLVERLDELAQVAPVALMVERATVHAPAWATAFAGHVRERGHTGVRLRALDAPWPAPAGTDLVVAD